MFVSLRSVAACAAVATLALALPAQGAGNQATFKAQPNRVGNGEAIHFYQTPEQMKRTGRLPPQLGAGQMEWFGGSVFTGVKVVSVLWGPNVNSTWVAGLPGYHTAIVNSTYLDQLGEYSTKGLTSVDGKHKGTQTIGRGSYLGQIQIKPKNSGTTLSNKQIKAELTFQIGKGVLPPNDANTLYMVYFPPGITIKAFNLVSCSNFGAYHEAVSAKVSATNIFYAVEPDCHYSFSTQTIISAHEFSEATTDNIPTPGTSPRYPQAWNNSGGSEIGDLCEGTQGSLVAGKNSYPVQQEYLNSKSGCSTGNYTSP